MKKYRTILIGYMIMLVFWLICFIVWRDIISALWLGYDIAMILNWSERLWRAERIGGDFNYYIIHVGGVSDSADLNNGRIT